MKKYFVLFSFFLITLVGFVLFEYLKFNDDKLHVVFCDVGQGDAIFITTPVGNQILIDGGPDQSVLDCLGDNMPFWDRSIDLVILTHPDSDHFGGLISVVDRFDISEYFSTRLGSEAESYEFLEAKLAVKNLSAKSLSAGDNFKDKSGANLQILSPRLAKNREVDLNRSKSDKNELSVVAKLDYKDFSALLTGDAEGHVLDDLVDVVGQVGFLKVPHHGSRDGIDKEILNILDPDVAVLSVGERNRYGHPDKEILRILEENNVNILRTDQDGEVEIKTDGKNHELH